MPSVSEIRFSDSTCGCRPATSRLPVRRCRSSASLTRSRSSFSAAATVSSRARLRPLTLPRACSSSSALGATAPGRRSGAIPAARDARRPAPRTEQLPRGFERGVGATGLQVVAVELVARFALDPANAWRRPAPGYTAPACSACAIDAATHSMRCIASSRAWPTGHRRRGERGRVGGRAGIGHCASASENFASCACAGSPMAGPLAAAGSGRCRSARTARFRSGRARAPRAIR